MTDASSTVWVEDMAEAYERWLVPTVFRPFAVDLARRVADRSPGRVLELAAGTGVLTRELVTAPGAPAVTATDLNGAMVDLGRRLVPAATWRRADAMDLPFDDSGFDVVAGQFGAMFFPDKPAAFAEARRVLAPDGVLLLSTWATLETHEIEAVLVAVLERMFPADPPRFLASTPHGYADVDVVLADLRAGGFHGDVETVTLVGHAESAAGLATGYCRGTPLRAEIEARADLATTIVAVAEELEARFGRDEVTATMAAHVFEATPAA